MGADLDGCSSLGLISVVVGLFDLLSRAAAHQRRRRSLVDRRKRALGDPPVQDEAAE